MSHETKTTVDQDEIRSWVEARGGKPALVKATEQGGSGVLRIDFPGYSGEGALEKIPWDQFFEIFEDRGLAFLYQDETKDGKESRFFKFVNRE